MAAVVTMVSWKLPEWRARGCLCQPRLRRGSVLGRLAQAGGPEAAPLRVCAEPPEALEESEPGGSRHVWGAPLAQHA